MRGDFPGKEMFSLGSLRLIFLLQTGAALEYPELYTHSARMGSSTTIPCQFNVDAIPPARRSFTMLWHFQEKEIFRSPNAPKAADPRLSIDQDRIQDGIADLSMSGVSIADGGLYICSMVQTPEGKVVKEIRLDIHAPPQIIITNKTALINKESVLRCAISGFYPVDIDIKWLRDGVVLDNVIMEIPQRDPSGTYNVNSSVTITPTEEDRKRIFSYRIQHESLTAPLQEDFRLVFEDEEITKQNILIISVAGGVGGVVILIAIIITVTKLYRRRGGRRSDKKAENQDTENQKLTCGDESGHVQETRHSINDTNKTSILNQQHEPRKEPNHSQITGTRSAAQWKPSDTTVYTPGDFRGTRHSINNTNETSIRNQQPEPREEPNHSQTTGTRSAAHRKPSDTAVSSSGNVRQPPDSIYNTNKTPIRNQQHEPREELNHSKTTGTRSVIPQKPSYSVSTPGDVRQPRDSIHNRNETSIRNPQPEPREEPNHSQMTGTTSVVHRKPSYSVSTPGHFRGTRDSINDTNKTPTRSQQPEPREEPNYSQMTGTRSAVHPNPPDTTVYSPGNPSLENQRSGHHQTMPENRKTKPPANNQEAEAECAAVSVKNLKSRFQN